MRRAIPSLISAGAGACVLGFLAAAAALAQPAPEFKLGFRALAVQIPEVVGTPLENEHWGANGDSLQQTSTGLMVWRKADNWTAFTNGHLSWVNGPYGVQSRFNDQRFEWERERPEPPAPAPAVSPGLILYRADWSGGADGWSTPGGWRVVDGMLVDDGSTQAMAALSAYQLEGISDYAVEAEIQMVRIPQRQRFGILVRGGYVAGIDWWSYANVRYASVGTASEVLAKREFDPGSDWHTYRVEVRGNRVRLSIDGTSMVETTDNRYLSPGRVGLWNSRVQLNVRSFKVVAL